MKDALISEMAQTEETHFWYWAKRRLIRKLIKRYRNPQSVPVLLDVGCGTGRLMKELSDIVICKGLDASLQAVRITKKRGYCVKRGDAVNLPFDDNSFEFVVLSDLLEHLQDDQPALSEVFRVLKPCGYAIITVPAHDFLYGAHDKALSHFRRYSKVMIRDRLIKAGFYLCKVTPTNMLLLLPAIASKLCEKKQSSQIRRGNLPIVFNSTAKLWYLLEIFLAVNTVLPFGLSLLVIAQKPDHIKIS